jgi:hypothetical protein
MVAFLFQLFVVVFSLLALVVYVLLVPISFYLQRELFRRIRPFIRTRWPCNRPESFLLLGMIATNAFSLVHGQSVPPSGGVLFFGGTPAHTLYGWPFPWFGFPDRLSVLALPILFALTTLFWSAFTCAFFVLASFALPVGGNRLVSLVSLSLMFVAVSYLAYVLPALLGPVCWKRLFWIPCVVPATHGLSL